MTDEERAFQPRVTVGSRVPCVRCHGSGVVMRIAKVEGTEFGVEEFPVLCGACNGERRQEVRPTPEEAAG